MNDPLVKYFQQICDLHSTFVGISFKHPGSASWVVCSLDISRDFTLASIRIDFHKHNWSIAFCRKVILKNLETLQDRSSSSEMFFKLL